MGFLPCLERPDRENLNRIRELTQQERFRDRKLKLFLQSHEKLNKGCTEGTQTRYDTRRQRSQETNPLFCLQIK